MTSLDEFAMLSILVRETVASARSACERTHETRARSAALREECRLERESRAAFAAVTAAAVRRT